MRLHRCVVSSTLALAALAPQSVRAQQPLSEFLESASEIAYDVRESEARLSLARSQVDEARGRLLPSITSIGTYQRNQYDAVFMNPMGTIAVQLFDSLTATFSLAVPILDVGSWSLFFQSEALASSAEAQLEATHQ